LRTLRQAFLLLALLLPISAFAQHSARINFTVSSTPGVASYDAYRAPCTGAVTSTNTCPEGTFAKVGSTTTSPYIDTAVTAGSAYAYYLIAVCPSTGCTATVKGSSAPSNHIAATIPFDAPQPPVLLDITTARVIRNGANVQLSASWVDNPGFQTSWTLLVNGSSFASGTQTNPAGNYGVNWVGKINPSAKLALLVCDQTSNCINRAL
jgi:hypothetical protein